MTTIVLNSKILTQTSIAASMIVAGVVLNNSIEQLNTKNKSLAFTGAALFIAGWVYMGYALSASKRRIYLMYILSAVIAGSVIMMKSYMVKGKKPPMMLPAVFAVSWILLGYFSSAHLYGLERYSGLLASAAVLASVMVLLSTQRKKAIVDGPGMPLFVIGMTILVFVNSKR